MTVVVGWVKFAPTHQTHQQYLDRWVVANLPTSIQAAGEMGTDERAPTHQKHQGLLDPPYHWADETLFYAGFVL